MRITFPVNDVAGFVGVPWRKIEPEEAPEETLRREIREELECDIQVGAMVADTTYQYPTLSSA